MSRIIVQEPHGFHTLNFSFRIVRLIGIGAAVARGRYRVYSLKRRWSLEELAVQRYDDVDMNSDTSSTSMNINNCFIAQLLFLQ
jgi:hypothetical protein